ncbi:hypothetical protein [Paenibacillus sacheonensis]|uniref:Uncharacterized protein n=1 Tax=Paenibacillus sacheonensis TaxID=742054 RepID=A0A7X4YQ92_9BACL|nr:hypothetical protein [Paenibacillus sacheonensis]MBM7566304.1 ribosomal protein S6E (S10) [Paenibacillus sacheonensis]NBC70508.1 hypothetical protein [Paenibacillus sacheonensis]
MRPWVKRTLLVSVIIVAVGAGISMVAGEHGREVSKVVRVSQEFHGRPADGMKVEIRGGKDAAVPMPPGEDAIEQLPPDGPRLREGGMHIDMGHERHHFGHGLALGLMILIAGMVLFWASRRGKRSRIADGPNVLANIPTASDFLDQWEMQQNQTKESK